jgi:hypothetical protein
MARELICSVMEICIWENIKMENLMEKANIHGKMDHFM